MKETKDEKVRLCGQTCSVSVFDLHTLIGRDCERLDSMLLAECVNTLTVQRPP